VLRFSYDAIRSDTARCVEQVQTVLARDPELAALLVASPVVETPDMPTDPLFALAPSPTKATTGQGSYFDLIRSKLALKTLRLCQREAFAALANYYAAGGQHGATVMSVGAGKTVLGVVASLAFTKRRAMIVTPGSDRKGKGRKPRRVPLPPGAVAWIGDWLSRRGLSDGPLFPRLRRGGTIGVTAIRPAAIQEILDRRVARAGTGRATAHDFRRTMIGDLLEGGAADISTVAAIVGHASVTTTARYDRRGEAAKRRVADLLFVPHDVSPPPST